MRKLALSFGLTLTTDTISSILGNDSIMDLEVGKIHFDSETNATYESFGSQLRQSTNIQQLTIYIDNKDATARILQSIYGNETLKKLTVWGGVFFELTQFLESSTNIKELGLMNGRPTWWVSANSTFSGLLRHSSLQALQRSTFNVWITMVDFSTNK